MLLCKQTIKLDRQQTSGFLSRSPGPTEWSLSLKACVGLCSLWMGTCLQYTQNCQVATQVLHQMYESPFHWMNIAAQCFQLSILEVESRSANWRTQPKTLSLDHCPSLSPVVGAHEQTFELPGAELADTCKSLPLLPRVQVSYQTWKLELRNVEDHKNVRCVRSQNTLTYRTRCWKFTYKVVPSLSRKAFNCWT